MNANITLTRKQAEFIDAVKTGKNIFLTGKAGTGKSFIVNYAIEQLRASEKKVVALAPTGIAANNINGQTIHSMFAITPYGVLKSIDDCQFVRKSMKKVLKNASTVIIDEVSMLRPDILDAMHWTLIKNGLPGLDKKQVIFVGDLKQLPPILADNTRSVLYQTYDGDDFLCSEIFDRMNVITIELDEIMRQSDPEFINALNAVRDGLKDPYFQQFVHTESMGVVLAPHNSTVAAYNEAGLMAQAGTLREFDATIGGNAKAQDFNLEPEIRVKDGCQIMYLMNSQLNPLRNGTLGVFVDKGEKFFIRVEGIEYALEKATIVKKEYVYVKGNDALELQEIGSITQYPFKLAYALSIHKSQGLTFDQCTIDLRRPCFQKGQMYVALSRVRTPAGLRLIVK